MQPLIDSSQSAPATRAEYYSEDEHPRSCTLARRRELIKLEIPAIKRATEIRAKLLKQALLGLGRPSAGLSRSILSLRVPLESLQKSERRSSLPDVRIDCLNTCPPLFIVQATLDRLWGAPETATRSRILNRARRRRMALSETTTTPVVTLPAPAPDSKVLKRRSCPPVEVNWFAAKRRSDLPSSRAGIDLALLPERRRTLQTISELSLQEVNDLESSEPPSLPGGKDKNVITNGNSEHGNGGDNNITDVEPRKAEQTGLFECNLHRPESLVSESDMSSNRSPLTAPLDWRKGAPKDLGIKLPFDTEHLTVGFSLRERSRTTRQGKASNGCAMPSNLESSYDYASPANMTDRTGRSRYYSDGGRRDHLSESNPRRYSSLGATVSPGQSTHSGPSRFWVESPSRLWLENPPRGRLRSETTYPFHESYEISMTNGSSRNGSQGKMPVGRALSHTSGASDMSREFNRQYMRAPSHDGQNGDQSPLTRPLSVPARKTSNARVPMHNQSVHLPRTQSPREHLLDRQFSGSRASNRSGLSSTAGERGLSRAASVQPNVASNARPSTSRSLSRRLSSKLSRSYSMRRRRSELKKAQEDTVAALTAPAPVPDPHMTTESLVLLESQQKKLDEKIQRASVAYARSSRLSFRQGSRTNSQLSHHSQGISPKAVKRDKSPTEANVTETGVTDEQQDNDEARLQEEQERIAKLRAARDKIEAEKKDNEKLGEDAKMSGKGTGNSKKGKFHRLSLMKSNLREFLFRRSHQA